VQEFAPAKINLALHVTGRRDDGYYLLDSLVAFASAGDRLTFSEAEGFSLHISGPFADALGSAKDNLVTKAARRWAEQAGSGAVPVAIQLEKNLPVASGIGGGSADAAATLRGLRRLWRFAGTDALLQETALELGADVPVCLAGISCRMTGIGETLSAVSNMPTFHAVLVNPMVPVATADVFRQLAVAKGTSGLAGLEALPSGGSEAEWIDWLARQRNDLEAPAVALEPAIAEVLTALRDSEGCLLARMSGSGATCFALYRDEACSRSAAERLAGDNPGYWIAATLLG
jgi:4-diphosphocytidyl-2-C-methyl-D-erythritol kinase